MTEVDYLAWLQALITGQPLPGEYAPGTDPLTVMTGHR